MKPKPVSAAPAALATPLPRSGILFRLFALDVRTLAVFRIALALVLLADLAIRGTDLHTMYADEGMFARDQIRLRYGSPWNWSLHFLSGTPEFQTALFALAALAGLALLAGCFTRGAAVVSWLLLLSLQHRVPPILNAADALLRLLLLWGLFLPLGRVASVDAWWAARRGRLTDLRPVLSFAGAGVQLQLAVMYFFSACFKSTPDWFRGQVIAGSLAHDLYAKPLGELALPHPGLLAAMTWGVFALEWLGPLLLFSPWRTGQFRLLIAGALAAMHLGIELCLHVGMFSWVSLAGLSLFLAPALWRNREHNGPGVPAAKARRWPARLREGAAATLLLYTLGLNLAGLLGHVRNQPSNAGWKWLNSGFGLGQKWGMFDETPSKDGWYVARGVLADGSEIDLLQRGATLVWDRPHHPAGMFPNHRWRKLFREMCYFDDFGYQVFREPVARFLKREWNSRHPAARQVAELDLIFCEAKPGALRGELPQRERLVRVR